MKNANLLLFLGLSLLINCRQPQIDAGYWETADPGLHQFDTDALGEAMEAAAGLPNFYGLLVIRNNKLMAERYFRGKSAEDLFHLRSITKNFTSALTGIALAEGDLPDVDAPIHAYYPDLLQGPKAEISIRHLLNMSSGLDWEESSEVLDAIEHRIAEPVRYLLAKELVAEPDSQFNYNSLSPHVVADLLVRSTGYRLAELAQEKLFKPLDIRRYAWTKDPQGAEWGGFGLQLTARDLAKFGQLYLNEGAWDGQQLVPRAWVQTSSRAQIQTFGPTSGYSFQWWTGEGQGTPIFYGQGYGGQALMLVPAKQLIVVAVQEYLVDSDQHLRQWNDFVQKVFFPIEAAAR